MSREEHPSFRPSYADTARRTFRDPLAEYSDVCDLKRFPTAPLEKLAPGIRAAFFAGVEHFHQQRVNPDIQLMAAQADAATLSIPIEVAEHAAQAAVQAGFPLDLARSHVKFIPQVYRWRMAGETETQTAVGLTPQYLLQAFHEPHHALTTTARLVSRIRDCWHLGLPQEAVDARAYATVAEVTHMLQIDELGRNVEELDAVKKFPMGFDSLPSELSMSQFLA